MRSLVIVILGLALALTTPMLTIAVNTPKITLKELAKKYNVTSVLVFGDSSVDPGNNNHLPTDMKSNFSPYGKDFFDGKPTGRFSNGRLTTDFIAEALGYTQAIPAFLDRNLTDKDLIHGVSFASGASGYDDLTANFSNVLPVSKQLEYLMHYKIRLSKLVGAHKTTDIIKNAIFVLSMGTNDFLQNYYLEPARPKQYTLEQYQNYLLSCMSKDVKLMHKMGATKLIVVGVPPMGCMPLVMTLAGETKCVEKFNNISSTLNNKLEKQLAKLKHTLGMSTTAFVDCFAIINNAINNPHKYGLTETTKGCCGTGTIEYGTTCKGLTTCEDASKYAFWDAVHPTQKMYQIVADEAIASLIRDLA
ncbi:hypothetical protein ACFE04_001929 [Oxalis oulophora]